tara:strand:+ start:19846 stop:20040 length:195 start_codon:yes stop_codon:yes gene_type:complete
MDSFFLLIIIVVVSILCLFLCFYAAINITINNNMQAEDDAVINEIFTRNSRKSIEFISEKIVEV